MSETPFDQAPRAASASARVVGRRGEAYCLRAQASLAGGRHAEALEALRRARRLRPAAEAPRLALAEADALLSLARYRDAAAVAARALAHRTCDGDLVARLRVIRGQALWRTGPISRAEGEVRKAARQATTPLTRARVLEAQALFAWKAQELEAALAHLAAARELYARHSAAAGLVRVLEEEAGVLRDAGRLPEALAVQDERLATALRLGRADLVALARSHRGGLLTAMGKWEEAAAELDAAADGFRELADPREFTVAAAGRVVVDLARGDLPRARAALDKARELNAERGNTRCLAENLLLTSDLHLASGERESAERTAVEALGLFRLVGDAEGECRARVRRAHALVALGRHPEAAREGRRALRCAAASRRDLVALSLLALGRALLRLDRAEAGLAFDRAVDVSAGRPVFTHVARLGLSGARGADRDSHEVLHAIAGLEAWGDRRILAYSLADMREVLGATDLLVAETAALAVSSAPALAAVVDAAAALLDDGPWAERWAAAMRAIRSVIPWARAALVGEPGWELRVDIAAPRHLAPDDLARRITAGGPGPRRVDLREAEGSREDPDCVLHGLTTALLAPVAPGLTLYVDVAEGEDHLPDDTLAVLGELARLVARRPPEAVCHEPAPAFAGIVGACPDMQALFRRMARVAPSDLAVHVTGETGTGKELVAEALHRHSHRASGPFVAVNASALSDELFEAEMFGHVRGAFTGALGDRQGHVEFAEGGTLFLDEITDLSQRAQAKLLRFLERREYRRVGESRTRRADVRIVSAANVPLEGRLRPDLIFRLKDVVLALPPLRERGDDLWALVQEFLHREARPSVPAPVVAAEARRRLQTYSWPGNVRELHREIRRAVVMAGRGPIRPEHLSIVAPAEEAPVGIRPLKDALLDFEREYVGVALRRMGGNRARTAAALGISRQALVVKIARLGIG